MKFAFRRRRNSGGDQPDGLDESKRRSVIDLSGYLTAESTISPPLPSVTVKVVEETENIDEHDNQIPLDQASEAENDQIDESKESLSSRLPTVSIDALNEEEKCTREGVSSPRDAGRVGFSRVEIKEYPICLGDNPAVSRGIPIAIGWDPFGTYEMGLEEYERSRPPRRLKLQLKMDSLYRIRLLKRVGYSHTEIKERLDQVDSAKRRRHRTARLSHYARISELLEWVKRGSLNATCRRRQKRDERAKLQKYRTPKNKHTSSWPSNTTMIKAGRAPSPLSVNMIGEIVCR